jgi:hypothetical protein
VPHGGKVLVVDGLLETEEVLRAVLEPRGLEVARVRCDRPATPDSSPDAPDVLVIHQDDAAAADSPGFDAWRRVPRVVIGSMKVPAGGEHRQHFLQQPFQYPELVRAIERLLTDAA